LDAAKSIVSGLTEIIDGRDKAESFRLSTKHFPLDEFIWQIFGNADQWGRRRSNDSNQVLGDGHFLRVEYTSYNVEKLRLMSNPSEPTFDYLQKLIPGFSTSADPLQVVPLVEVSVLDSGPGIGEHYWRHRGNDGPFTFEDEWLATRTAIRTHATSDENDYFGRGGGIPAALQAVATLRGLLRVRTGRLSLYRDFLDQPWSSLADESPELWDAKGPAAFYWDWASKTRWPTELPRASGTAYTLTLPLGVSA
jgi:hypothetical protein